MRTHNQGIEQTYGKYLKKNIYIYVSFSFSKPKIISYHNPLIGKDGDDVIDNITCELTVTESMCG